MNLYASLATFKGDTSGGQQTPNARDEEILRTLDRVSRWIDRHTSERFYSEIATRQFDTGGSSRLRIPRPRSSLISVTTFGVDEDGDGVYETSLAASDYWLYPNVDRPSFREVVLNPESTTLTAFPSGMRRAEIVGRWGYSDEVEAVDALNGAVADAVATSFTLDNASLFSPGDTIRVDAEDCYVRDVDQTTLTVTRGVNGTTAIAHADDATVSRIVYEPNVAQAAIIEAARRLRLGASGYAGSVGPPEVRLQVDSREFAVLMTLLDPYREVVLA